MSIKAKQPPISNYAFISNCHSSALISTDGSIDWCCMPDFGASSCFARILDFDLGGHCSVKIEGAHVTDWNYLDGTLILRTVYRAHSGECVLHDFFAMSEDNKEHPRQQLYRLVECTIGHIDCQIEVVPRFDYAALIPWFKKESATCFSAIGGEDALIIRSDRQLDFVDEENKLVTGAQLREKEQLFLSLEYIDPARIAEHDFNDPKKYAPSEQLTQTKSWWHRWSEKINYTNVDRTSVIVSAVVLKGLFFAPTGAVIAAPTTSLPESAGGSLNWDYRYSWIRDSVFTVRALEATNSFSEADQFRQFIQRSAAGRADTLQIMYGITGKRRLTEMELPHLSGYHHSQPVRVGNAAHTQRQLDCYGTLMQLVWHWHQRGSSPDDDTWRFLLNIVDTACSIWEKPGHGFWEFRTAPRHYVYAKVMCWAAVNYGIKLSEECLRRAPISKWRSVRKEIAESIEQHGIDHKRNYFTEAYGSQKVDGSLLLIPHSEFVDWSDPRMIATCDLVMEKLDQNGLIRRYKEKPTGEEEATFVACTFWLAECLARQRRLKEAKRYFENARSCANEIGLFSEEYDATTGKMLGNFPQALSHLSHINAALAIAIMQTD